jgi:histone-lysine N-methyltransferase SUV420H
VSDLEQKVFHKHLINYANLWSPDCPIVISTTNRYNITSFEAAVAAKKNIRKGEFLTHLYGILGEIRDNSSPSAVLSTMVRITELKKLKEYLFLGPARFLNHDCEANAEFFVKDNNREVIIRTLRTIEYGEEITVNYGENYFGSDYASCLCRSCEIQSRGGWKNENTVLNKFDKQDTHGRALRRRAPDSMFYSNNLINKHTDNLAPMITQAQSKELRKLQSPRNRIPQDYMLDGLSMFQQWYICENCKRKSSSDHCLFCGVEGRV